MPSTRRTVLAALTGAGVPITAGCFRERDQQDAEDDVETDTGAEEPSEGVLNVYKETIGQAEPIAARLDPQEPYEIREANGKLRVLLPEKDGREMSFASWAEEVVVAERVRSHLLDTVERELGVRPESGIVDGIQVDLMRPDAPEGSPETLTAFGDPDESRLHLEIGHITTKGDDTEPQVEPDVSYETVVSSTPRSIDVTVTVDGADDYFARVPVVCRKISPDE